MSRSHSILLQRLALSLSTVVPELRRLEYQWVGLAKFKNFIVLYFTKARLAQTLRICYFYLEISLRLRSSRPRSLKVLNCAYVLWSFQSREMACKNKTRYTQKDLQFALRVVEGGKSLSAAAFRSSYILSMPSRTTVSLYHYQMSILLFSHLKQSFSIL